MPCLFVLKKGGCTIASLHHYGLYIAFMNYINLKYAHQSVNGFVFVRTVTVS